MSDQEGDQASQPSAPFSLRSRRNLLSLAKPDVFFREKHSRPITLRVLQPRLSLSWKTHPQTSTPLDTRQNNKHASVTEVSAAGLGEVPMMAVIQVKMSRYRRTRAEVPWGGMPELRLNDLWASSHCEIHTGTRHFLQTGFCIPHQQPLLRNSKCPEGPSKAPSPPHRPTRRD